jgi:hypothetical protein
MTEREFALYEALKILMSQMVEAGVVDYPATRRRLAVRQQNFRELGMTNAAAIIGTLMAAVEPLPQGETPSPLPKQPLDDLNFVPN